MAIRARASITISRIVDISSVTRYYKLQSSTTIVPPKPTTNPPSGWTTTEPSYSSGSTDTLYFVDCTVMTNGTFSYSEVSVSSSYEAAKEAYNKASAVGGRVDDCNDQIEQVRNSTHEEITNLQQNVNSIVLSALKGYVETGDFSDHKEYIASQLELKANKLTVAFTKQIEEVKKVNGELQGKFNSITKYFDFNPKLGLLIGETGNEIVLRLDNDIMEFLRSNNSELQLTADGVKAERVNVSTLIIGNVIHAADENGDEIVY